jgi:hypothetical protein
VLTSFQFVLLGGGNGVYDGRIQPASDLFGEHAYTAARDGAEGEFAVAGDAELAHDEDIERSAERLGDFVGDRDPSARKTEHEDIVPTGEVAQRTGNATACLSPVPECSRHGYGTTSRYAIPAATSSLRHGGCPHWHVPDADRSCMEQRALQYAEPAWASQEQPECWHFIDTPPPGTVSSGRVFLGFLVD